MIGVHSFTGDEQGMAELMVALYEADGPARAVAAGGDEARERARDLAGTPAAGRR